MNKENLPCTGTLSVCVGLFLFPVILFTEIVIYHGILFQKCCLFGWNLLIHKIVTVSIVSALILLLRNRAWACVVLVLLDCWAEANLIYFRAYGLYLNYDAIVMIDNMRGFWSSIFSFIKFVDLLLWLPTFLFVIYSKDNNRRYWKLSAIIIAVAFPISWISNHSRYLYDINERSLRCDKQGIKKIFNEYRPIYDAMYEGERNAKSMLFGEISPFPVEDYVRTFSFIDYIVWNVGYAIQQHITKSEMAAQRVALPFTSKDREVIKKCISANSSDIISPNSNLIVILFESLESWVFEDWKMSENIAPNLRKLIASPHTLYASRMISEARQGASGDGQMTTLTGLLPLQSGAACMIFGTNEYPGIPHLYSNSYTVNPCPGAWNQSVVNEHYGIKRLIELKDRTKDIDVMNKAIQLAKSAKQPFFQLLITSASHSPFTSSGYEDILLPPDMPDVLKKYVWCVHYTDACIGQLINTVLNDEKLQNTTIVIVGDHTIFKQPMLQEFHSFSSRYNISIKNKKNYIPFIVYSPHIPHRHVVSMECYQMDVYPTVKNIIGCQNYYWRGLGLDLSRQEFLGKRYIDETSAYQVSEKLIRSNYFSSHNNK